MEIACPQRTSLAGDITRTDESTQSMQVALEPLLQLQPSIQSEMNGRQMSRRNLKKLKLKTEGVVMHLLIKLHGFKGVLVQLLKAVSTKIRCRFGFENKKKRDKLI